MRQTRSPRRDPSRIQIGMVFGTLTVVGPPVTSPKGTMFPVICSSCGQPSFIRFGRLNSSTQTCGCRRGNHRHGGRRSRLYKIWCNMRDRVCNPSSKAYSNYGGRGITISPEWDDFAAFRAWAVRNGYRDDLTLDRVDNDGPYSPDNCRWATMREQSLNRRSALTLSWDGTTQPLAQWVEDERCVVTYHTAYQRITRLGWSVERALTTPCRTNMK